MADKGEQILKKFFEVYGTPDAGFHDFLKTCKKLTPMFPSESPNCNIGYVTPEGEILHQIMIQPYYEAKKLQARLDDVIVASYPKTGTTWTQEISYLVAHDANFEKAKAKPLEVRFPFIEIPTCGIKSVHEWPERRLIKTHLPYDLLPPTFLENKTKIIYIARNLKDTTVSFYHFMDMLAYIRYKGTLEEFLDLVIQEKVLYSSFAKNVLSYWNRRHQDNILFLTYEDLAQDLKSNVAKIATFLGKSYSDDILAKIAEHCTFDSMKKNPMANYSQGGAGARREGATTEFLRKGKVGDWKNCFTDEMSRKVDQYIEKKFAGSGLEFVYELD